MKVWPEIAGKDDQRLICHHTQSERFIVCQLVYPLQPPLGGKKQVGLPGFSSCHADVRFINVNLMVATNRLPTSLASQEDTSAQCSSEMKPQP